MLNLILNKATPRESKLNAGEYDVQCEKVLVRLGPYDNSDYYEIRYLPDTDEVVILLNDEAISSYIMEQP
jgi:hypothetical protein